MKRWLKVASLSAVVSVLSGACRPDFQGLTNGDSAGGAPNGGKNQAGHSGCEGVCAAATGGMAATGGAGRGNVGGGSSAGAAMSEGGAGGETRANEGGAGGDDAGILVGGGGGEGGSPIDECFPILPEGDPPILQFDFDDGSGSQVPDSSGNENHGMLAAGRLIAQGRHGRALELTGKDEYVAFPGSIVSALDALTVAMWVRLDTAPTGATLFDFGSDVSHRIALTANTGSGTRFSVVAGAVEESVVLPRALPLGVWVHVATVLAEGKAIVFVNGIEIGAINATLKPSDLADVPAAWIGRSHDTDVDVEWALDDFRLYDRGLLREEIAELARPDYLHFDFDEPCGDRVHDRSERALIGELPKGGTWGSGRIGGSLELDGVEQYVALPAGIVEDCDDFTLAFWAQRTSATGISEHIIDFGQNQRTFLYVTPQARGGSSAGPGPLRFAIKLNGAENDVAAEFALTGLAALPLGLWQHVAVVIDDEAGHGTLYVDGVQNDSRSLPHRPSDLGATASNAIGRSQYYNAAIGPDPFYAGRIDDLRIACRPFSAAEIAFLADKP